MSQVHPIRILNPVVLDSKPVDGASFGQVHLVGAGPGDPELITVKAMRLLQEADAIVYDRLANPALLNYAQECCDLIYVGKKKSNTVSPKIRFVKCWRCWLVAVKM